MLVCEDAWHSLTGRSPRSTARSSSSCPPRRRRAARGRKTDDVPGPASVSRWERLTRDMADEHGVYVALANLVGSEAGKSFPGCAMLAGPKGEVRARAPLWDEAIVSATIDLGDVTRARADMPLLADLETMMPHLRDTLAKRRRGHAAPAGLRRHGGAGRIDGRSGAVAGARSRGEARRASVRRGRSVLRRSRRGRASGPPPLEIDARAGGGVARALPPRRDGAARLREGASSACRAASTPPSPRTSPRARSAPENVVGVRMPYRTSSPESLAHAPARDRRAGHRGAHGRHQRRRRRLPRSTSPTPIRRAAAT